ncbi:hypothetical protein S101447_01740 [Acetobacter ascendens]|uniref:Uncharacterized protein n=1 Tax=Acetobacter ascendens TaxID=481146 RepID=A0A1Y0V4H6_9PROT|nr:hypothetical protein S101447_01740 [Acetobacter ascendens]
MFAMYDVLDEMIPVVISLLKRNVFQKMQAVEITSIKYGK